MARIKRAMMTRKRRKKDPEDGEGLFWREEQAL